MGKKDTKAKEYISDNHRFADICNLALFNGQGVLEASDLVEKDSTEVLSILGVNSKEIKHEQKWRDLLKSAIIKISEKAIFVLIGIENQAEIHYAMPVKSMIYDALNYGAQVNEAAKKHKDKKDANSSAEFLSGFTASDKLTPVIPITLYLGPEPWDAPLSLYDMFDNLDDRLKPFIPDYKMVLVAPNNLSKDDLNKLETDMKEFLGAIKYSKDVTAFETFIEENPEFKNLNNETVSAINIFTGAEIEINKKGGTTNVCKAIEDMKKQNDMMNIKNLFINGGSLELAIATFKNISEEVIRKIYEEVAGTKTLA